MTIFAGAFSLTPYWPVPSELRTSIRDHLRTDSSDGFGRLHCYETANLFIIKWNSERSETAGSNTRTGRCVPLLAIPSSITKIEASMGRLSQLVQLADASEGPDDAHLAACRGTFALFHYSHRDGRVSLATDAIGLRSIYYLVQDDILIFATALRILETMPDIRRHLSTQARPDYVRFPFHWRNARHIPRSVYFVRVKSDCDCGSTRTKRYYDWADEGESVRDFERSAEQLHRIFREAVEIRAGADSIVYSFLSGGMDSRAIVATLIEAGKRVEALNFSSAESQDQIFAQRFSAQVPQQCTLHCLPGGIYPNFLSLPLRQRPNSNDQAPYSWIGQSSSGLEMAAAWDWAMPTWMSTCSS